MRRRPDHLLFSYGTLEFPCVMQAVTGRRFPGLPAVLPGFARYAVRDKVFPGIAAESGAVVHGTVFCGLERGHLRLIDEYEDAFYRRRLIRIRDATGRRRMAWTYIVPNLYRRRLAAVPWDPEVFARCDLADYLRRQSRRLGIGARSDIN